MCEGKVKPLHAWLGLRAPGGWCSDNL